LRCEFKKRTITIVRIKEIIASRTKIVKFSKFGQ
jgi:hypothetical protein